MVAVECFCAAVVTGGDGKVRKFARGQGVSQGSAENPVAAPQRDDRLVVERIVEVDERAVRGERPVAEGLRKVVVGIVVVDAENGLVFPAKKVLCVRQLHSESHRALSQPRQLLRGVRTISNLEPVGRRYAAVERWPGVGLSKVIIVVAAVAAGGDQMAVVSVR